MENNMKGQAWMAGMALIFLLLFLVLVIPLSLLLVGITILSAIRYFNKDDRDIDLILFKTKPLYFLAYPLCTVFLFVAFYLFLDKRGDPYIMGLAKFLLAFSFVTVFTFLAIAIHSLIISFRKLIEKHEGSKNVLFLGKWNLQASYVFLFFALFLILFFLPTVFIYFSIIGGQPLSLDLSSVEVIYLLLGLFVFSLLGALILSFLVTAFCALIVYFKNRFFPSTQPEK